MSILTKQDIEVKPSTCEDGVCKLTPASGEKKSMVVKAIKAEVYSRIVGYYRPVQDWNRGKKEEFGQRHQLTLGDLAKASEEM